MVRFLFRAERSLLFHFSDSAMTANAIQFVKVQTNAALREHDP